MIAADSTHARRIAALLREATGRRAAGGAPHRAARGAQKLAAFTRSRDPWIVAVNMVSEGVDIPRLRVGVYATAAKTPLVFRQIVGRFVRTIPGRPPEPSWLYIPADPVLRDHAADDRGGAPPRAAPGPRTTATGRSSSRPSGVATERSEAPAFVAAERRRHPADDAVRTARRAPAAADPGQRRYDRGGRTRAGPTPTTGRRSSAGRRCAASATGSSPRSPAATGPTHREVNAWMNRKLGIKSVEKATARELERSVNCW